MCLVFSCKDIPKKDKYFYKILIKLFAIMKSVTIFVSQYNGNEFKKLQKIKIMTTLKTKKLALGYYVTEYKGQEIKICKTDFDNNLWYSQINNGEVNDYSYSKKNALESAIYMIDNPHEYGLKLK
jgi:hypothetical protein